VVSSVAVLHPLRQQRMKKQMKKSFTFACLAESKHQQLNLILSYLIYRCHNIHCKNNPSYEIILHYTNKPILILYYWLVSLLHRRSSATVHNYYQMRFLNHYRCAATNNSELSVTEPLLISIINSDSLLIIGINNSFYSKITQL
jgi:hypothetical protein